MKKTKKVADLAWLTSINNEKYTLGSPRTPEDKKLAESKNFNEYQQYFLSGIDNAIKQAAARAIAKKREAEAAGTW